MVDSPVALTTAAVPGRNVAAEHRSEIRLTAPERPQAKVHKREQQLADLSARDSAFDVGSAQCTDATDGEVPATEVVDLVDGRHVHSPLRATVWSCP